MKLKNISTVVAIVAGSKIEPGTTVDISVFGSSFIFDEYEDEILGYINSGVLVFLDPDTNAEITDINIIRAAFVGINIPVNSYGFRGTNPDFYYNYKTFTLDYKAEIQFEFVGLLKTLNIFAKSGDIEFQIVDPIMNKVYVEESTNYEIDADYRLLNPIIRIIAKTNASVDLYMDGTFKHISKTKKQYLKEIYSNNEFPSTDIKPQALEFKVNFKRVMTSNVFRDIVKNKIGKTYNNLTLKSFNKFRDSAYVKFDSEVLKLKTDEDFTLNIWFKSFDPLYSKQYLFYKQSYVELYVEKGQLITHIDGHKIQIANIEENKYHMITMTYNSQTYSTNIYVNDEMVASVHRRHNFTTSNQSTYFGAKKDSYYLKNAELGEFNYFSHHFSAGMVHNLYVNNHPDHQFKDMSPLCQGASYTYNAALNLSDSYSAGIIRKEYANIDKLISTSKQELINVVPDINLNVYTGYVYIPLDGRYTFNATFNQIVFTIDGKDVIINEPTKTYYIEQGYYPFIVTAFGPFSLTYGLKGAVPTPISVFNDEQSVFDFSLSPLFGGTVTGVTDMIYNGANHTEISNISNTFYSDVFTLSLEINANDDDCEILSQGALWNEYFNVSLQEGSIVVVFRGANMSTNNIKSSNNKIDITTDGSKVYLYLNGKLEDSTDFYNTIPDKTKGVFIGSGDGGLHQSWMSGGFMMVNMTLFSSYSTPKNIEGRL